MKMADEAPRHQYFFSCHVVITLPLTLAELLCDNTRFSSLGRTRHFH